MEDRKYCPHYIYDDATIYLDRKYEKFLEIVAKLEVDV